MKPWGILIFILLPAQLFAQNVSGVVIDKFTKQPVAYAAVTTAYLSTYTSDAGGFNLQDIHPGDTISITCMNYKPLKLAWHAGVADTIYLQQVSILLRDVAITAQHNHKLDSIRTRNEFLSIFGYRNPTIKDAFITKNPYLYVPYNYIDAPNSTTSIVSVNLLEVVGLLSKDDDPSAKLKKVLLKDEESNYVDRVFSKQKVTAITSLKNDSLRDFMAQYRPTLAAAKKMTDYDALIYIKKSYDEFIRYYDPKKQISFGK